MKSVLDLYKALMQRKLEVAEAQTPDPMATQVAKAVHPSTRATQTVPAAAVRRSRRTDLMLGGDSDYERV